MNKIRVIFVIPEDCEDESQASATMRNAYAACKLNVMQTNWIREQDGDAIDPKKTDFVVFDDFKGALYEQILTTKSVSILGPWCLMACIADGKPIPNLSWPIKSMAMDGCVLTFSSLTKGTKQMMRDKVQAMGGKFCPTLAVHTTHLVTDTVRSEKYHKASETGIALMLPAWVEAVWEASLTSIVHCSGEQFAKYKCPPFHNLTICMTGVTDQVEKAMLEKAITNNGGLFSKCMNPKKTDILVCKGSSSDKYKAAMSHKIDCVTPEWIFDSDKIGYAIPDLRKYAVRKGTSTPTKSCEIADPNFSMMSAIGGNTLSARSVLQETINVTNTFSFASPAAHSTMTNKRKSPLKDCDLLEAVDIKRAKRAGSFLDGCGIYLVGFASSAREKLCKILNFSGATRYDSISDRITHIVIGDTTCHELKLIRSKNLPCAMVSVKWVLDSMEKQEPVSEEEYFVQAAASPRMENSSPLSKKGLRLLKADVSILETKSQEMQVDPVSNEEDNIMKQYRQQKTKTVVGEEEEDTLAAMLEANNFDTLKNIESQKKNTTIEQPPAIPPNENESSQSIAISMDATNTFQNATFLVVKFSPEEEEAIKNKIVQLGGNLVAKNYKGIPNYVIVPCHTNQLKHTADEIVSILWLEDCVMNNCLITDIAYYHRPINHEISKELDGLVVTLSGYPSVEKAYLKTVCELMGGFVQDSLVRAARPKLDMKATTHLITADNSGKKYEAATKWGLPVVDNNWLLECMRAGKRVDVDDYRMGSNKENDVSKNTTSQSNSNPTPIAATAQSNLKATPVANRTLQSNSNPPTPVVSTIGSVRTNLFNTSARLNISVHKQVSPPAAKGTNHNDTANITMENNPPTDEEASTTPAVRKITNAGYNTPKNNESPYCSQITPVSQIMQRAMCNNLDLNMPITPKPWNHVDTPNSPVGAFLENPPPPELKKKFQRWINSFPEFKPKDRRLSTPMSELKRRLWHKICPQYDEMKAGEGVASTGNDQSRLASTSRDDDCDDDEPEPLPNTLPTTDDDTPENAAVAEQFSRLQDMVIASGASSRRSSIRKLDPVPSDACYEKESQPCTVGWDFQMDCGTTEEATKKPPPVFMFSGIDPEDREELVKNIESLGGTVSDLSNYDPACTHLLCPKLFRNEKFLASMASGKWILHISYVEDSMAAGKLLDEEEYEYGNQKSASRCPRTDRQSEQRAKSVHYWRKEISRRGYGAFHDMQAVVVVNKREPMIRVIEAGGGKVLNIKPPFTEEFYLTHCIMEGKAITNMKDYIPLAQRNVFCVNSLYVNEFLNRTANDVREYIIADLSKYYSGFSMH